MESTAEKPKSDSTESTTKTDPVKPPSLPKVFGKVVLTLDNVLIPPEKLSPTPSFLDGLDAEDEIDLRIMGCELITTAGILLKLPQTAMATGQVLFQRFYYSKSFVRQPMEVTAMACIYLASKIEEAPRRIRDVVNVFHHIKQVRASKVIQPMILDATYIRLKNDVTLAERRVLKELGFCVHVKHPHKLIVVYMQMMRYDKDSKFVQKAWNYMSDALRSNVFVRYTPEEIACACIYLSARVLKIPLPTSPPWWIIYGVQEEALIDICETILALYDRPKVDYDGLTKRVDKLMKAYQDSKAKGKTTGSSVTVTPCGTPRLNTGDKGSDHEGSKNNSPLPSGSTLGPSAKGSMEVDKEKEGGRKSLEKESEDRSKSHKKRKKLRRSSYSRSRSRSRSRERVPSKKRSRRSPSISPPRRHHHKKKSHHRERYRERSYSPDGNSEKYTTSDYYHGSSKKSSKYPRDDYERSKRR